MGHSRWTPTDPPRSHALAKLDYEDGDGGIAVKARDTVRVIAESPTWAFVEARGSLGHIPISFLHFPDLAEGERGSVLSEVNPVLRLWHGEYRRLYVTRSSMLGEVEKRIGELHELRRRLLTPDLPSEGTRELRKEIATVIDSGNNLLKLDMCVRDERGVRIDPGKASTLNLFRLHVSASEKLKKEKKGCSKISRAGQGNPAFLVTLHIIKWRVVDRCELNFFLYDGNEAFTESAQGIVEAGPQLNPLPIPLRFLFTDLSKSDFDRTKIYLVVFVIRVGMMEPRDTEPKKEGPFGHRWRESTKPVTCFQDVRRPWGVGVAEVTDYFKNPQPLPEEILIIPYSSFEQESLTGTLNKMLTSTKDNKGTGPFPFSATISLVTNPQNLGPVFKGRKMGFPDVILPADVRNELYIRLVRGEFSKGSKTTEKNVEARVSVHDNTGNVIPGFPIHRSVVYYHDDRPKWSEVFRIPIPSGIDDFTAAHLRFSFRHRSSSEAKDRADRPFAIAFLKLRHTDGTAVPDALHYLLVYKVDGKQWRDSEAPYLNFPSHRDNKGAEKIGPFSGISLAQKDGFQVWTVLCSTKFTQNAHLLELLQWSMKLKEIVEGNERARRLSRSTLTSVLLDALHVVLVNVSKVSGEEIVKFLPDIFDALFSILVDPIESLLGDISLPSSPHPLDPERVEKCDAAVFDCLLHIFSLLLEPKYENFDSVVALYIREGFSATLAYRKLLGELLRAIDQTENPARILSIMKCIKYFFKFIIASYEIRMRLNGMEVGTSPDEEDVTNDFEGAVAAIFFSLRRLLLQKMPEIVTAQGGCLKYVAGLIEPLLTVLSPVGLTEMFLELINAVQPLLTRQKLATISDVVKSGLFLDADSRTALLPLISVNIQAHLPGNESDNRRKSHDNVNQNKLKKLLGDDLKFNQPSRPTSQQSSHSDEIRKSVEVLGEILEILSRPHIKLVAKGDISILAQFLLEPILLSIYHIGTTDPFYTDMVTILLALLDHMTPQHYVALFNKQGKALLKFINFALLIFKNFFTNPPYHSHWLDMLLVSNKILFGALEQVAETLKLSFSDPFEKESWRNLFFTIVSFITQPSLQLENFENRKVCEIVGKWGDMRTAAAELIRLMWFSLAEKKRAEFVPRLVGTFLDMGLVPQNDLRLRSIPIFFDMMRLEGGLLRDPVEHELVSRLVDLVEGGRGDRGFRDAFVETMMDLCEESREPLGPLLARLARLFDLLLAYQEVISEEDPGNKMSCIVQLLEFSQELNRGDLYLRYLYHLHNLHIGSKNFTEAAFTLKLHSRQLSWSGETVAHVSPAFPQFTTHAGLKEALYSQIISYFDKAKLWECALEVSHELRSYFEGTSFEKLPELHRTIANFYEKIVSPKFDEVRLNPKYFRVAFVGKGFPSFLHDTVFVCRGAESEFIGVFTARMQERFPLAEILRSLDAPSETLKASDAQYLQICHVQPVSRRGVEGPSVNYYRYNEVDKFTYSRPFHRGSGSNEFENLWVHRYTLMTGNIFPGILAWSPVIKETVIDVSPIQLAVETVKDTNESLKFLLRAHAGNPEESIGNLTLKLQGVLDAAVNGGLTNYETVFLTKEYVQREPDNAEEVEALKREIRAQVPILSLAVKVHSSKAPEAIRPLHQRIEGLFKTFSAHVEEKYGKGEVKPSLDEDTLRELEKQTRADSEWSLDGRGSRSGLGRIPSTMSLKTEVMPREKRRPLRNRKSLMEGEDEPRRQIVALSQNITPHRPLRSEFEFRKSIGEIRRSMDMTLDVDATTNGSNDLKEEEITPPPIPPKRGKEELKEEEADEPGRPPTPPPKKPPLKQPK